MIGIYSGTGTQIRGYQSQSGRVQDVAVVTLSKSSPQGPQISVVESKLPRPMTASEMELDLLSNLRSRLQSEISSAQALLQGDTQADLTLDAQHVWNKGGAEALVAYVGTLEQADTLLGKQQDFRQAMFGAETEAETQSLIDQALGDRAEQMLDAQQSKADWGRQRALLRLFAMTGQDSEAAMAFLEKGKALARAGQKAALVADMKEQIASGELNVSVSTETAWAHEAVGIERVTERNQISMVYSKTYYQSASAFALSAGFSGSYSRSL
ncbi:hypothetical protein RPE78_05725 [Thioclava litoralis]|uniref:Uncharacterized protein n=1 Tax=Thioclava litoralis TaxID=3076557 RepID=A0ABZ1E147_9RHOB|nr:hypothetical protein RPE78_05725 [Thioclava sp. FTW29]